MQTIRIGNDITIRATVTRRGADEDLTGKTLTLLLRTSLSTVRLTPVAAGNQLTALWPGTEQEKTGKYTVTLVEDYGTGQRNTVDAPAAFALVPVSSSEGEGDTGEQTVELDLDVTAPASGLSAYELALLHGYTGTEQEWIEGTATDEELDQVRSDLVELNENNAEGIAANKAAIADLSEEHAADILSLTAKLEAEAASREAADTEAAARIQGILQSLADVQSQVQALYDAGALTSKTVK